MRLILTHIRKTDEYSRVFEIDTPLGLNETHPLSYDKISKKEFERALSSAVDPQFGGMKLEVTSDEYTTVHTLTPRFCKIN